VPKHLFRMTKHLQPTPWVCFGARAPRKGKILNNVRKALILAAITGTLVSVPSATANAEPMGFDPNVAPAAPAPAAPPPPAPDAPRPPAPDAPPPPAPDAPPPAPAGFDPNLPPPPDAPAPDAPPPIK